MVNQRKFECQKCGHAWDVPFGTGKPPACPKCESDNICRAADGRGGGCGGQGRGNCARQGQRHGRGPGRGQGNKREA